MGFKVGNQRNAELLMNDYMRNDFVSIINYCKSADFFQDVPFSKPKTYEILEKKFTDAKFILTIRDSSEIWYNSLVRFHNNIFFHGKKPTSHLMKNISYVEKGWFYNVFKY